MRILIVEDERRTAETLQEGLQASGHAGVWVASAEAALDLLARETFDAAVVDVMLPGMSGLELVRCLRDRQPPLPSLVLSARGALEDRLMGLEAGADDYLSKPYSVLEVVARLRTVTRRVHATAAGGRISVADLVWDPGFRRMSRGGERLDLTPKEYALLALLMEHPGEVVPRSRLIEGVWGMRGTVDANAVDVQILRLRRKVDAGRTPKLIHTLRGVGLVLEPRG